MKKLTDKELNDIIEEIYEQSDGENISLKQFGIIGKYKFIGTTLDPNYFTRGDIKTDNEIFFHKIKIEGKFYTIQINWTRGSKKDSIVLISKEDSDFSEFNKQLSELKELPTEVSNGVEQLDIELIKDIIKQKLNCKYGSMYK